MENYEAKKSWWRKFWRGNHSFTFYRRSLLRCKQRPTNWRGPIKIKVVLHFHAQFMNLSISLVKKKKASFPQELSQKLQFQCEESELESVRLAKQNKKSEELLAQCRYEIQELKLMRRKLRMKFENQLHQLIDQHKQLHAIIKDSQPKK
ncbi:uncharacterized protein LOC144037434 isoform X2 [Vanacampus margaritifer]